MAHQNYDQGLRFGPSFFAMKTKIDSLQQSPSDSFRANSLHYFGYDVDRMIFCLQNATSCGVVSQSESTKKGRLTAIFVAFTLPSLPHPLI